MRGNVGERVFSLDGLSEYRCRLMFLLARFKRDEGFSESQLRLRLARSPIDSSRILHGESGPCDRPERAEAEPRLRRLGSRAVEAAGRPQLERDERQDHREAQQVVPADRARQRALRA